MLFFLSFSFTISFISTNTDVSLPPTYSSSSNIIYSPSCLVIWLMNILSNCSWLQVLINWWLCFNFVVLQMWLSNILKFVDIKINNTKLTNQTLTQYYNKIIKDIFLNKKRMLPFRVNYKSHKLELIPIMEYIFK